MKALVERDIDLLSKSPELVEAIQKSPSNPDKAISERFK